MSTRWIAAVVTALVVPCTAWSQAAPLEAGGGRPPASDASPDALEGTADVPDGRAARADRAPATGPVNPSRPTFSDNARFVASGHLELETGYGLDVIGCPDPDGSALFIDGAPESNCNLQQMNLLLKYAHNDRIEARIGWDVFGTQGTPVGESVTGVGDVYVQGKFGLGLAADRTRHQFALLGTVRPGVGQAPIGTDGLTLEAFGVYGFTPGPIALDAQAGLVVGGLGDDTALRMPLSAVVGYQPAGWVTVFGELVETLTFDDLNASETSLLAGAAFGPAERMVVDVAGGVGLSETLPDAILRVGLTVQLGAVRTVR